MEGIVRHKKRWMNGGWMDLREAILATTLETVFANVDLGGMVGGDGVEGWVGVG